MVGSTGWERMPTKLKCALKLVSILYPSPACTTKPCNQTVSPFYDLQPPLSTPLVPLGPWSAAPTYDREHLSGPW